MYENYCRPGSGFGVFESVDLSGGPSAPAAPSRKSNSQRSSFVMVCDDHDDHRDDDDGLLTMIGESSFAMMMALVIHWPF